MHGWVLTCDDAELRLRLKGVKQLNDVFMAQLPQDFDLLSQVLYVLFGLPLRMQSCCPVSTCPGAGVLGAGVLLPLSCH